MKRWIKTQTQSHNGRTVYEVKCPVCGMKETFHDKPSAECYLCQTPLEYIPEGQET